MNNPWEKLFSYAIQQLEQAGIQKRDWSFGGGTVLSLKYGHRESKDIDIFLRDPQLLSYVSPRTNDATEAHLLDYAEQSIFTRLQFQDGEVDFIVSSQVSSEQPTFKKILGHHVYVDSPVEIVAKKIQYRAEDFKPRDMFDLATVYSAEKQLLLKNAPAFADKLDILCKRISALEAGGDLDSFLSALPILEKGKKIRGQEVSLCKDFIREVSIRLEKGPQQGRSLGFEHKISR